MAVPIGRAQRWEVGQGKEAKVSQLSQSDLFVNTREVPSGEPQGPTETRGVRVTIIA